MEGAFLTGLEVRAPQIKRSIFTSHVLTSDSVGCTSTIISAWQYGFLQAHPRLRHKVGDHPALQLIAIPDTLDGVGQTNTANKQLISKEDPRLVLQKFVDLGDGSIVNKYYPKKDQCELFLT